MSITYKIIFENRLKLKENNFCYFLLDTLMTYNTYVCTYIYMYVCSCKDVVLKTHLINISMCYKFLEEEYLY